MGDEKNTEGVSRLYSRDNDRTKKRKRELFSLNEKFSLPVLRRELELSV